MPDWQPNWNDVRWDHYAAEQAIAALQEAAKLVDDSLLDRLRVADEAIANWQGNHRQTFDSYRREIELRSRSLAAELREKANEIRRKDVAAYEEQRRRERERRQWLREKEDE